MELVCEFEAGRYKRMFVVNDSMQSICCDSTVSFTPRLSACSVGRVNEYFGRNACSLVIVERFISK